MTQDPSTDRTDVSGARAEQAQKRQSEPRPAGEVDYHQAVLSLLSVEQLNLGNHIERLRETETVAQMVRALAAERRDGLKWIAAFSIAGLFSTAAGVGQHLGRVDDVRGVVFADGCFLASVLAAVAFSVSGDMQVSRRAISFRIALVRLAGLTRESQEAMARLSQKIESNQVNEDDMVSFQTLVTRAADEREPLNAVIRATTLVEDSSTRLIAGVCAAGFVLGLVALLADGVLRLL